MLTVAQQIVGVAVLLTPARPRAARIYSLAVQADFRRRGYASQLLEQMVLLASKQGYRHLSLEVRQDDLQVQQFYQKHGFQTTKLLAGYYEDGADGVKMLRALAAANSKHLTPTLSNLRA